MGSAIGGLEEDLAWIREQGADEQERAANGCRASRIESRLRIMRMNLDDAAKAGRQLADQAFWAERQIDSLRAERDALLKQAAPRSTKSDPPDDGQRVFYFFEPFGYWHVGEWRCGIGFHGRSGFCDDNDAPYWLPEPPAPQANEQEQADER